MGRWKGKNLYPRYGSVTNIITGFQVDCFLHHAFMS